MSEFRNFDNILSTRKMYKSTGSYRPASIENPHLIEEGPIPVITLSRLLGVSCPKTISGEYTSIEIKHQWSMILKVLNMRNGRYNNTEDVPHLVTIDSETLTRLKLHTDVDKLEEAVDIYIKNLPNIMYSGKLVSEIALNIINCPIIASRLEKDPLINKKIEQVIVDLHHKNKIKLNKTLDRFAVLIPQSFKDVPTTYFAKLEFDKIWSMISSAVLISESFDQILRIVTHTLKDHEWTEGLELPVSTRFLYITTQIVDYILVN